MLKVDFQGDVGRYMASESDAAGRAVVAGVTRTVNGLKNQMRGDVRRAQLGRRLANSWRGKVYKNRGHDAAGTVWSKAPHIMEGFEVGATLESKDGFWLAIPTPSAPKGRGGKKMTPALFEKMTGLKLRFIYKPRGPSLLVADGYRASGGKNPGRIRRIGTLKASRSQGARSSLRGRVTVPMFYLVRRARLKKRISFDKRAGVAQRSLSLNIIRAWK